MFKRDDILRQALFYSLELNHLVESQKKIMDKDFIFIFGATKFIVEKGLALL